MTLMASGGNRRQVDPLKLFSLGLRRFCNMSAVRRLCLGAQVAVIMAIASGCSCSSDANSATRAAVDASAAGGACGGPNCDEVPVQCDAGLVPDDGLCRPTVHCNDLDCGARGQTCIEATSKADAVCSGCVNDAGIGNGACSAASCPELGCDALHRTCESSPSLRCKEECIAGYVWDANLKLCRAPKQCADLKCLAAQTCAESTDGKDALCQGALCPAQQGWDTQSQKCRSCAHSFSPNCGGTGETGSVLLTASQDGADCVCETQDGYYLGEGAAAVPCDADGDGWVSDSSQSAIEGSNPVLRSNARCRVRRVEHVILENELGESQVVADYSDEFGDISRAVPTGLPLYESARNDGAPSAVALPAYPGRPLVAKEVNSLTKACAPDVTNDDFDDNGVTDVHEWFGSKIALSSGRGASTQLNAYYTEYAQFSYFVELHNGWYEEVSNQDGGNYRIQERKRSDMTGKGVPILYPANETVDAGVSLNEAQSCTRHIDGLYDWATNDAGTEANLKAPATAVGGDLAQFGDIGWHGMTHHSQYKCVQAVSTDSYQKYNGGNPATEAKNPDIGFSGTKPGTVQIGSSTLFANSCAATTAVASTAPGSAQNPQFSIFKCSPMTAAPKADTVVLAAVDYENGMNSKGNAYVSYLQQGDYHRGCINECVDMAKFAPTTWPVCQQCQPDSFGKASIGYKPAGLAPCDEKNPTASGMCNGQGTCGACAPGVTQCVGTHHQTCTAIGAWKDDGVSAGVCNAACSPGAVVACTPCGTQTCDSAGNWSACPTDSPLRTYYPDSDGDGHGVSTGSIQACAQPSGYSTTWDDCDDARANRYPGNPEVCGDGVDNDCNNQCEEVEGCILQVYERAFCQNYITDYRDCTDNLLTPDPNEGNPAQFANAPTRGFTVYTNQIPGVTSKSPLLRCLLSNGHHYVSQGGCSSGGSVEGTFGYPLAAWPGKGSALVHCVQQPGVEMLQINTGNDVSCSSSGTIAWSSPSLLGYDPVDYCWNQ